MTAAEKISIKEYNYHLPEGKIALYPLKNRDNSKLLIYKGENIKQDVFSSLSNYLPEKSLLVFNNTKVINARIRFQKKSGSSIEIFCLEPAEEITEYSTVMNQKKSAKWKCFIGGAAKWKEPFLEKELFIDKEKIILKVTLEEKLSDAYIVEFTWSPATYSFAEILESAGDIPLPPYIKRSTELDDLDRYQTIYAMHDGSVAAPTAGLHFTDKIFETLLKKHIQRANITLHVGAGTFKPVKAAQMQDHEMHTEWIDVTLATIQQLIDTDGLIVAIGTTSLRTIETLYWLGVKAILHPESEKLILCQWDVYSKELNDHSFSKKIALEALINWLAQRKLDRIFTQTQLLITPGYSFKIGKALVTNFHQPQSTLLLLVAAAIGEKWKEIYDYALENDFRFLSYGDGSLIFMAES